MILLVGLGNPGEKYQRHRHNVGFMAVDEIASTHGFQKVREKFNAHYCEGVLKTGETSKKAIILKPQTYMNESGTAVRAAAKFFKLSPDQVVVFYDELDLAPGKLRVKTGGGAAGHNGIRSIDAHLGNQFRRVRIGIGHPGDKSRVSNHVLGNFAKADHEWLTPMLSAIAAETPHLLTDDQRFASAVAQRISPNRKPADQANRPAQTDANPRRDVKNSGSSAPVQSAARQSETKPADPESTKTNSRPGEPEENVFAAAFRRIIGKEEKDKS